MREQRLLDLFCCAGGAGNGYYRAGFEVVGVDINPQPNYPYTFIQGDALDYVREHFREFDVIHASPPCQAYSPLNALPSTKDASEHPDLVAATRAVLNSTGRPWVIENVMSAPLLGGIRLCGGMFGLRTYRHRRFETTCGLTLTEPQHPKHVIRTATKRRRELWNQGWHVSITGDVGTYLGPEAMGIDWMTGQELCEAIPPPYTEFIGVQLLQYLSGQLAA
jgi:DNA (cytosine-5)-methyltransferase 1